MTCTYCNKQVIARGLCSAHYNRLRKYGDPHLVKSPRGAAQKFIREIPNTDICVPWPFKSKYSNGYGAVSYNGALTGAHRAVCAIYHGEPKHEKLEAAHSCGRRDCVNPRHIRWATAAENAADKVVHGKNNDGEANPQARLDQAKVKEIRALAGTFSQAAIAQKYGTSRRNVGMILQQKTWKGI